MVLFVLGAVSQTSGLQLSASTGGVSGASSMTVTYGATVVDYLSHEVKLNPDEGTLSNALYGTGDLPYAELGINDDMGNSARVFREVIGDQDTSWKYDWKTYKTCNGVGATLSLSANDAYSIHGGGSAFNKKGDKAEAYVNIQSYDDQSYPQPSSSLKNYKVTSTACASNVKIDQTADYASGSSNIDFVSYCERGGTDIPSLSELNGYLYASSYIGALNGEINKLTTKSYSDKTKMVSTGNAKSINAASIFGYGIAAYNGENLAYAHMNTDLWLLVPVDAVDDMSISSSDFISSLSNYMVTSTATNSNAKVDQKANAFTSIGGSISGIYIGGSAGNAESDSASSSMSAGALIGMGISSADLATSLNNAIYSPTTQSYSAKTKTQVYATARSISSNGDGYLEAYANSAQGHESQFTAKVHNGKINNPKFGGRSGTNFAETYAKY